MRRLAVSSGTAVLLLTPALATRVTVPGTTLSLDVPPGFTRMTADLIALKYPRGAPPRMVYSAADSRVNIAFELRDSRLPAARLNEFGVFMKDFIGKNIKVIRWEGSGPRSLGGRVWYALAFTFQAADQPVYDRLLITSEQGRALVVTVNATTKDLPRYRPLLDQAVNSLRF